jgi:hypothetical protein
MRHEEESLISLLLTQSVLLGIFYGAFDIGAHSLFLSVFDEKDLARAYAISGFIGIILTGLFFWFKGRINLRNLAVFSLFFVTILSLILWATLNILPSKLVIFIIFVMFGPLNIIALLGFRISGQQFFSIHKIKRLPGLVDSAIIIGIIVISSLIPLLLSLQFRSRNLLLISTISLLVAATIQIISGRKLVYPATKPVTDRNISGLSGFSKDPFIRIIGVFIALSVMVVFFIQYSFMAVTREQYPVEEDMARFLGLFTGVMMILALLSERVLFSYIIKSFGLRLCLLFSPVILAGLTVITIILGLSFGYTPAASG